MSAFLAILDLHSFLDMKKLCIIAVDRAYQLIRMSVEEAVLAKWNRIEPRGE
ncbi:hypothetical protein ES702_03683 [subsurface metagenome]